MPRHRSHEATVQPLRVLPWPHPIDSKGRGIIRILLHLQKARSRQRTNTAGSPAITDSIDTPVGYLEARFAGHSKLPALANLR